MNYNKDAILAVADAFTVAEHIGIETVKKGGYVFIRCPDHAQRLGKTDQTISNCVLKPTGYTCYSCGAFGDVIDLVKGHLNCSFAEALKIVANIYGGTDRFKEQSKVRRNVLSSADLAIIGLHCVHNPDISDSGRLLYNTSITRHDDTPKVGCTHKHQEYVLYVKGARPSLQELYDTDRRAYYSMIEYKAKEAAEKYKQAIVDYCSPRGSKSQEVYRLFQVSPNAASEVFSGIRKELERKQKRAESIYQEYRALSKEFKKT